MKKIRLILIVLAAPALTLLALHELGGTPISKGYDTGFHWKADVANSRIVLTIQPEGDLTCWLRVRIPDTNSSLTAETSKNERLRVYKEQDDGHDQWIALVKQGQAPQEQFIWASGASIYLYSSDRPALALHDWYVFPNNKSFDSRERTRWREGVFWAAIGLLILAGGGGVLEGVDKIRSKREPFSPQLCVEGAIHGVEGSDKTESERMQLVLEKVLIEGARVEDALASLPLSPREKTVFWFKTAAQFRSKLEFLIKELMRYLSRLGGKP